MKRRSLPLLFVAFSLIATSCGKQDNRIEVNFSWNFETEIATPEPIKVALGSSYGTLPTPNFEREGFTFDGWNVRRDGKGDNVTPETVIDVDAIDHTLFAKWLGKQYTVSFDLHGGNVNGATELSPMTVTCGNIYGAMVIPSDPTKKLGTFLGWYLNEEGTGEQITYSSKVKIAADHILHAVYKETKLDYTFDSDKDLEDFSSLYDAVDLSINNNNLEIKNVSEDPRAYMALHAGLRAGCFVDIDAEFVGTADASEGVRAGMYVYGLSSEDTGIAGGYLGDPNVASTREEIKNWYFGQGANNVQAWELAKWNNGHIRLKMNILEDCYGVYFMFDFGRKVIDETTHEIDLNRELWQDNKWVIHSIHIDYADYEIVKDEYNFDNESDIESFIHPENVNYSIDETDNTLKISKGETDDKSYLEFETQYIKAGTRVKFDITYYGEDAYSSSNTVGIFTYGNYPNGKILNGKTNENGFDTAVLDTDPQQMKDFYWGGYGATNEPWAPCRLYNGQKVSFTNYVFEDSYGITMMLKFGTANGYFKISHIEVHKEEAISEFDFAKESQLNYFTPADNVEAFIDGDNEGDFLKVSKKADGENFVTLNTLIKKGQTVKVTLSYVTSDPVFVNGSNQFTFLAYKTNLAGKRVGDPLGVMGNAPWDGGWDSSTYEFSATMSDDCYGIYLQFVFNKVENSYFRVANITIL